jgi:hypothetical protein
MLVVQLRTNGESPFSVKSMYRSYRDAECGIPSASLALVPSSSGPATADIVLTTGARTVAAGPEQTLSNIDSLEAHARARAENLRYPRVKRYRRAEDVLARCPNAFPTTLAGRQVARCFGTALFASAQPWRPACCGSRT